MNNEIDWSKAPKGTTHIVGMDGWRKRDGDNWYGWIHGGWVLVDPDPRFHYEPRPVTWTGEGLPPVGTVCEIWDAGSKVWLTGEVIFTTSLVVVMRYQHDQGHSEACYDVRDTDFRPLLTPEQIAAEEREREIEALATDIMSEQHISGRVIAERLHALGYRKVEGGEK